MIIEMDDHRYIVGDLVASTEKHRLYLCEREGFGERERFERQCLLQIAADVSQNGPLERAAYILKELKRRSDELEAEYAKAKIDPNDLLNYHLGFPELVDSFVCEEQGGRRINILAFRSVNEVTRMIPIQNLIEKDRRRVDLQTSAWIMGKCLKLLAFAHSYGILIKNLDANNILIEPNEHYVVFFDWSEAEICEDAPGEQKADEIAQAAKTVIAAIGGDYETGLFPEDAKNQDYLEFLCLLADGGQCHAQAAHTRFYKLIDGIWKREFYPFTSYPI